MKLSLNKNLTWPNGRCGETKQSTVTAWALERGTGPDKNCTQSNRRSEEDKTVVVSGTANQWLPRLQSCAKGDDDEAVRPLARATTFDIWSRLPDKRIFPVSLSHSHPESVESGSSLPTLPRKKQNTVIGRKVKQAESEVWKRRGAWESRTNNKTKFKTASTPLNDLDQPFPKWRSLSMVSCQIGLWWSLLTLIFYIHTCTYQSHTHKIAFLRHSLT